MKKLRYNRNRNFYIYTLYRNFDIQSTLYIQSTLQEFAMYFVLRHQKTEMK